MLDCFPGKFLLHTLSFLSSPKSLSRVAQAFVWEAVELEKQSQLETICRRKELEKHIRVVALRQNWWEERALQRDKRLILSLANVPSEPPASSS
jgi:hypothetical protein